MHVDVAGSPAPGRIVGAAICSFIRTVLLFKDPEQLRHRTVLPHSGDATALSRLTLKKQKG